MATSPQTAFYVAVGDRPHAGDLAAKVAYDGGAQVVEVATSMSAAGSPSLADLTPGSPGVAPCPNSAWTSDDPALDVTVDCSIGPVGETPYFPGAGWAATGKTFVVVDVGELRILNAKASGAAARRRTA